jgi:hypothetical protein
VKGWIIAGLAALGALLGGMVKADLEDEEVCRWLARKLVYRATQCLPADERDRWREELIRDLLDLKGRVPPLWWALSTWLQAGRWGRERGVPSRWEMLVIRVRLVWQRLRSLSQARSRALSKQPHPSRNPDTAQRIMAAAIDAKQVVGTATLEAGMTATVAGIGSTAAYGPPTVWVDQDDGPDGLPHLTYPGFLAWLRQERQGFEVGIDRKIAEYRRQRNQELGL